MGSKGNEIESYRLRQDLKDLTSLNKKSPRVETRASRRKKERKQLKYKNK